MSVWDKKEIIDDKSRMSDYERVRGKEREAKRRHVRRTLSTYPTND